MSKISCPYVLLSMFALAVNVSWSAVVEADFTQKTVPACVSGIEEKHLEKGVLSCNGDTYYRLNLPEGFKDSVDFTFSIWFAPHPEADSGQTALLQCRRSGYSDRNTGFWFGFTNFLPEFRWWITEAGEWRGIDGRRGYAKDIVRTKLSIRKNAWQMVTAVCRGTQLQMYLNETLVAEMVMDKPMKVVDDKLRLGVREDADDIFYYTFSGVIGKVYAANTAMDGAAVSAKYTGEKDKFVTVPEMPGTEGYDPDFKIMLKRTARYLANQPGDDMPAGQKAVPAVDNSSGVPVMKMDGKAVFPMMFAPSCWAPDEKVLPAVQDFAASDVTLVQDLFSTNLDGKWAEKLLGQWWEGTGKYNWKRVDERFAMFLKGNPKSRFILRIKLDLPAWWWMKAHPEFTPVFYKNGKYDKREGWNGMTSPEWEEAYSQMLTDFVAHIEASSYAGHVIGYLVGGGSAGEWYYHGQDRGLVDYSQIAHRDFSNWIARRYGDITALNQAWNSKFAKFSEVKVPAPELRLAAENGVFRDPVKARPCIDYVEFLNDITIRCMNNTAKIIKKGTGGRCLVGYFYSYLPLGRFSLNGFGAMQNNGHTALGEAVKNPDINFFATPLDYGRRKGGGCGLQIGNFNGTYMLNNKLYWEESDYRTHLAVQYRGEATANEEESINVMRRTFGYMLTKGHAEWWFALVGNHVFHTDNMMDDVAKYMELGTKYLDIPKVSIAEAAIVMDEPTVKYLSMTPGTSSVFSNTMWGTYESAHRSGALFDMYLSSDLANPKMKDYKLYIFTNQCFTSPEMVRAIQGKLKKNNAIAVWLYAPGYVTSGKCSTDSMKELTGMEFSAAMPKQQETPVFTVSGRAGLVPVSYRGFRSVYSARALTPAQTREICKKAGIHVYSESDDVLSANGSFLMLHTTQPGLKTIWLPEAKSVFEIIEGKAIAGGKVSSFCEKLDAKTTRIYKLE